MAVDWHAISASFQDFVSLLGRVGSIAWIWFIVAGVLGAGAVRKAAKPRRWACSNCGLPFAPSDYRPDAEHWLCTACGAELLPDWDASGPLQ